MSLGLLETSGYHVVIVTIAMDILFDYLLYGV